MKKITALCTILFLLFFALPVVATVTGTLDSVSYNCTGTTGPFTFTFPVTPDATALLLTETSPGGTVTTLTTSAYTGTPVNASYLNGGSVTLKNVCPSGSVLKIQRNTPLTQTSVFTEGMPTLYKTFERSLDKLTMEVQDLQKLTKGDKGDPGDYYITPEMFGAKGDGITDDTAAIAAAITSTDETIVIGPYTYGIKTPTSITLESGVTKCAIVMKSHMHLKGTPGVTTIKLLDNASTGTNYNIFASNQHLIDVTVEDIIFDLNGANNLISPYNFNTAVMIWSGLNARVDRFKFKNCYVKNGAGITSIGLGQSNTAGSLISSDVWIQDNIFDNNGFGSTDHSTIYGWADNVKITGNTFKQDSFSTDATGARVAWEVHGANHQITDNLVLRYYMGGWISDNLTSVADRIIINDNIMWVQQYGLSMYRESSAEFTVDHVETNGNIIFIDDSNPVPGHGTATAKVGIAFRPSYGCDYLYARNNHIFKTGGYTNETYGFLWGVLDPSSTINHIEITGNDAVGMTFGVGRSTTTGSGKVKYVKIHNNTFLNLQPTSGITHPQGVSIVNGAASQDYDVDLFNNTIVSEDGGGSAIYGIYLAGYFASVRSDQNHYLNIGNGFVDATTSITRRYGKEARTFTGLPATSTWSIGDEAYTNGTTELGTTPKYLLYGWRRITNGTANVLNTDWLEMRMPTGN